MAIRYLLKHLDSAFVQEEESLPRFVDKALGNIQSWLVEETKEAERFEVKTNQSLLLLRKSSLFLASLAKCSEFCALIRIQGKDNAYVLKAYSGGKMIAEGQKLATIPPVNLSSWYSLKQSQAFKMLPVSQEYSSGNLQLHYIDEEYAIALVSSLPQERKSALLAKVSDKIKRLRL